MAGGTFLVENKKLPGSYINFKSVPAPISQVGSRGIATMAIPLSWGAEDELITIYSSDLLDGKSLEKVGFSAADSDSLLAREVLKYAHKLILFRVNKGGAKATVEHGSLTITAKHKGTLGNEIKVVITKNGSTNEVSTYFRGNLIDVQSVANIGELNSNAFVDFTGSGNLTATTGVNLSNGTDGTVTTANYNPYFEKLKTLEYQVAGFPTTDNKIPPIVKEFIKNQREKNGKKVQVVVYNYEADYEGIISSKQGFKTNFETISPENFVATVTGLTAGAEINESNTYKIIGDAVEIIGEVSEEDLAKELEKGWFLLTKRIDGKVVVLDDINTLTSFSSEKDEDFSSNRVIRVLDEIGNTTRLIFEKNFIGKESNDEIGRNNFKIQLIANMKTLQGIRAIQNFKAEDISIEQGEGKSDVRVTGYIQPVESMKKLYMTIFEK